jgi:hypothetical protein
MGRSHSLEMRANPEFVSTFQMIIIKHIILIIKVRGNSPILIQGEFTQALYLVYLF